MIDDLPLRRKKSFRGAGGTTDPVEIKVETAKMDVMETQRGRAKEETTSLLLPLSRFQLPLHLFVGSKGGRAQSSCTKPPQGSTNIEMRLSFIISYFIMCCVWTSCMCCVWTLNYACVVFGLRKRSCCRALSTSILHPNKKGCKGCASRPQRREGRTARCLKRRASIRGPQATRLGAACDLPEALATYHVATLISTLASLRPTAIDSSLLTSVCVCSRKTDILLNVFRNAKKVLEKL